MDQNRKQAIPSSVLGRRELAMLRGNIKKEKTMPIRKNNIVRETYELLPQTQRDGERDNASKGNSASMTEDATPGSWLVLAILMIGTILLCVWYPK